MDGIFKEKSPADRQQILFIDAVKTLLPAAKLQYRRMQQAPLVHSMAMEENSGISDEETEMAQPVRIADSCGFIGHCTDSVQC